MINPKSKYWFQMGMFLGYPICCATWFSTERMLNGAILTQKQEDAHQCRGFIPCPACAEMITADTLHTLIGDRQCITPFPEFPDHERQRFDLLFEGGHFDAETCGTLFRGYSHSDPKDDKGCILPGGHAGGHIFQMSDGRIVRWEMDYGCTCGCWGEDGDDFSEACMIYEFLTGDDV